MNVICYLFKLWFLKSVKKYYFIRYLLFSFYMVYTNVRRIAQSPVCKRYEEILFRLIRTFYFFSIESGVTFYKKEIDTSFWNTLSIFLKAEYSSKFMLYPKYLQLSWKLCQHPLKLSIRDVLTSDSDTRRSHTCCYMATSFTAEGLNGWNSWKTESWSSRQEVGETFASRNYVSPRRTYRSFSTIHTPYWNASALPTKFQRNFHSFRRGRWYFICGYVDGAAGERHASFIPGKLASVKMRRLINIYNEPVLMPPAHLRTSRSNLVVRLRRHCRRCER